ncbi:hypothetical protein BDF22DRAFT_692999 [Syncephalis plumigaleata]|nr:hypothetical protein BDF22DRAFT_692999 [Syncephalis plumigaleata]
MANRSDAVQLYADMDTSIADGDYSRVLECCDQLLKLDSQDTDALRAKLVTLIRLDRYHEALKFLDIGMPPAMARERVFERAYCLYRLERLADVEALFKTVDVTTSLQLTHLKAQVAYKMEDFPAAIKLYTILVDNTEKDNPNYSDLIANLIAAKAAASVSGTKLNQKQLQVKPNELETYDQLYNAATLSIANGHLVAAETLLRKASEVCRNSLLEQEYTEEEIQEELVTIMAQLAYVDQLIGKSSEAHTIQQKILEAKLGEKTVLAVVANNDVALQQPKSKELYWFLRRLQLASNSKIERKLLFSQRRQMAANRAIMQLWLKNYKSARNMAKRLRSHQPNWPVPYLISAAVPYYQGKKSRAVDELSNMLAQNSSLLEVRAVLARLAIDSGDISKAIELSKGCQLDPTQSDVSLLEIMTSVYESIDQSNTADELLSEAIKHSEQQKEVLREHHLRRLRGAFYLRNGMGDKAVQDYTVLVKANPDDKEVLVDLVEACAGDKPELARDYVGTLATPPVRSGQVSNAELATLEASAPGLKRPNDKPAAPSKSTKVVRKKRANPPAKNVNPDQPPNPERWLPKRERSDYKPKGRKRGAASKLATGPQGLSLPGSGGGGTGSARIDGKR